MTIPYANTKFALVKIGGRKFYMQIEREMSNGNIVGRRVDKSGNFWEKDDGKHWTQHMIVAAKRNVLGMYRLNLYYGELELYHETKS